MKKLLLFTLSAIFIACLFASCSTPDNTASTTTTVIVKNDKMEQGFVKRGVYTNRSLGISIRIPDGFGVQDYGDLVFTPDSADTPNYDFYITQADKKKPKELSVTIEANSLLSSADEFQKRHPKAERAEKMTLGNYEYTEFHTKSRVWLIAFSENNHAIIEFHRFQYEDVKEFIQKNFE